VKRTQHGLAEAAEGHIDIDGCPFVGAQPACKDRQRMHPQLKADSNAQGGKMSTYSKEKKEEHDL